jgi:hypothetical protein
VARALFGPHHHVDLPRGLPRPHLGGAGGGEALHGIYSRMRPAVGRVHEGESERRERRSPNTIFPLPLSPPHHLLAPPRLPPQDLKAAQEAYLERARQRVDSQPRDGSVNLALLAEDKEAWARILALRAQCKQFADQKVRGTTRTEESGGEMGERGRGRESYGPTLPHPSTHPPLPPFPPCPPGRRGEPGDGPPGDPPLHPEDGRDCLRGGAPRPRRAVRRGADARRRHDGRGGPRRRGRRWWWGGPVADGVGAGRRRRLLVVVVLLCGGLLRGRRARPAGVWWCGRRWRRRRNGRRRCGE